LKSPSKSLSISSDAIAGLKDHPSSCLAPNLLITAICAPVELCSNLQDDGVRIGTGMEKEEDVLEQLDFGAFEFGTHRVSKGPQIFGLDPSQILVRSLRFLHENVGTSRLSTHTFQPSTRARILIRISPCDEDNLHRSKSTPISTGYTNGGNK
jgi:hypothetical protein